MPTPALQIPLAASADEALSRLARATGSRALARLRGSTLLGERAMLANSTIPARLSAGGGCRLYTALGDSIAINLARATDRALLPALFESENWDTGDEGAIASHIARREADTLLERGRVLGLAIAAEQEVRRNTAMPGVELARGHVSSRARGAAPRVLDLSALWAGPLAAHLLWLAGAEVTKVEARTRPDALRSGAAQFHALLNQGKASVVLDFADASDRRALLALIAHSDIVIEAARPRALMQLDIDAARIVDSSPGLLWMTITGHGTAQDAANWVGFGDDCGVAAGLSAALRAASGHGGFVGDAIADPLTGIAAASIAWERWQTRRGGRFGVALADVVEGHLTYARQHDPRALNASLRSWGAAAGRPFPAVERREIGFVACFGADTHSTLRQHSC